MPSRTSYALPPGRRDVVAFEDKTSTDDAGQPVFSTTFTSIGVVSTKSSREFYLAAQDTSEVTHLVSIMYPLGVNIASGMRAIFRGRRFYIQALENVDEANRLLRLLCVELNDGAGGA